MYCIGSLLQVLYPNQHNQNKGDKALKKLRIYGLSSWEMWAFSWPSNWYQLYLVGLQGFGPACFSSRWPPLRHVVHQLMALDGFLEDSFWWWKAVEQKCWKSPMESPHRSFHLAVSGDLRHFEDGCGFPRSDPIQGGSVWSPRHHPWFFWGAQPSLLPQLAWQPKCHQCLGQKPLCGSTINQHVANGIDGLHWFQKDVKFQSYQKLFSLPSSAGLRTPTGLQLNAWPWKKCHERSGGLHGLWKKRCRVVHLSWR